MGKELPFLLSVGPNPNANAKTNDAGNDGEDNDEAGPSKGDKESFPAPSPAGHDDDAAPLHAAGPPRDVSEHLESSGEGVEEYKASCGARTIAGLTGASEGAARGNGGGGA